MKHWKHWIGKNHIVAAAVIAVFMAVLYVGALNSGWMGEDPFAGEDVDLDTGNEADEDASAAVDADDSDGISGIFRGLLYTVEDYDALKEKLENSHSSYGLYDVANGGYAIEEDVDYETSAAEEKASSSESDAGNARDHSSTNLREENVDEGDIVKTDGQYIYSVSDNDTVRIVAANGKQLSLVTEFLPDFGGDDSILRDLYIAGDKMVMVGDSYTLDLDLQTADDRDIAGRDVYRIADGNEMVAVTYDISDRAHPKKLGQFSVEGNYQSSRIADGYLYLFSWYYGNDVPRVMGELPEVNDIYLTRELGNYSTYTMTSLSLDEPAQAVDEKVIYIDSSDVYVTSDAIVVEYNDYSGSRQRMDLFRFAYAKGKFKPVGVNAVPGTLESSFSIDEDAKGNLRVATTAFGYDRQSSGVYIFDRQMHRIGKLTGLAKGEDIKAARFLDDMLYLVTYENHDPVFSIDLSDPTEPKLLGSLEIPGFSDYLHFWDDSHLLGIGYDTDEETSAELGIKLSMFDISDPADVREESHVILNTRTESSEDGYGYDNVPGLSDYKALLVDPSKNLIGFGADSYYDNYSDGTSEEKHIYFLHSYDGAGFLEQLGEKASKGVTAEGIRGIYIGDVFYLVDDVKIRAYDMENGFTKVGKLVF